MSSIIFSLPGNEAYAAKLAAGTGFPVGELTVRQFPDGESYVRVLTSVDGKEAVVVCTLHHPDEKIMPLIFLLQLLKDLGASKVKLVVPYLSYMRQDKRFNPGEAVTSEYFAKLLSGVADELITIDPHLHRRSSMNEIYSIPCSVLHASPLISAWIKQHVEMPVLIGPDSESEQWVAEVARNANAPYLVLEKVRYGDRDVRINVPQVEQFRAHTPVLVDDIISTAGTMIKTVEHLKHAGMKPPVCIGVHAVFAGNAYDDLLSSGAARVITCDTIPHPSNAIDTCVIVQSVL